MAIEQRREKYTMDKKKRVSYVNDKMDKRSKKQEKNESALKIEKKETRAPPKEGVVLIALPVQ